MRSARAAATRDLPIPGSPEISTICPSTFQARSFQQEIELVLAADEIGQTRTVRAGLDIIAAVARLETRAAEPLAVRIGAT